MSGDDLSFSIDPVVCMQAHTDLDTAGKKLLSLLSDIESDASPLTSTWTGAAADTVAGRSDPTTAAMTSRERDIRVKPFPPKSNARGFDARRKST